MATDFVRAGSRLFESQAGLRHLGVPFSRQVYVELPDGELGLHISELTKAVESVVGEIKPDRMFTLGPTGYDSHEDHIAAHEAAIGAASGAEVLALAADHRGEVIIGGDSAYKFGAMAMHASQAVSDDLKRWGGVDMYTPLIVGPETYYTTRAL